MKGAWKRFVNALLGENAPFPTYQEIHELATSIDRPTYFPGVGLVFPADPNPISYSEKDQEEMERIVEAMEKWAAEDRLRRSPESDRLDP